MDAGRGRSSAQSGFANGLVNPAALSLYKKREGVEFSFDVAKGEFEPGPKVKQFVDAQMRIARHGDV